MSEVDVLRRYTSLPSALHILHTKRLTLLNPAYWEDKNDAFFVSRFKEITTAKSVLALCFAQQRETFHHWRIFAGSDGVCFEFHKDKLLLAVAKDESIRPGAVTYKQVSEIAGKQIPTRRLPFLKRYPYADEREFRLLHVDMDKAKEFHDVEIPLSCILRITVSPWMAAPLVKTVKQSMKSISGCERLKVYRTTLLENEKWKKAANRQLVVAES